MAVSAQQIHRQRRGNMFYFRISVPLGLHRELGREYKRSLGTSDYKLSAYLCRIMSCKAEEFFMAITKKIPTDGDLRQLMRNYFEKQLEDAMLDYTSAKSMFVGSEPEEATYDPYGFISGTEAALNEIKNEASSFEYTEEQENEATNILEGDNFETFQYATKLAEYMMDALIEAKRIELAYHQKKFSDTDIKHPLLIGAKNVFSPSYKAGVTLRQCVDHFLSYKDGKIKAKSLHTVRAIMSRLCEILGEDRDMQTITKSVDGVLLERVLPKIPTNYVRDYKNKGKLLMQVIEGSHEYEKISDKTASTYWMYVQEFFSWAEGREFIHRDPVAKIKFKTQQKKEKQRTPFNAEKLSTLFSSPIYTGRKNRNRSFWLSGNLKIKDGNFWLPLIGLYTGMREGEILQITPDDVKTDDGKLYFDVNEYFDKELKTTFSARKVPIHPELIKIGLAQYLAERKTKIKKDGRIFQDGITIPEHQEITKNYSRSFSEYTVRIGLRTKKDGQEVFHSFRHNLQTALSKAGVKNTVICKIIGHAPPADSMTTGDLVYDHNELTITELYDELAKAKYDIDLSHLYITE